MSVPTNDWTRPTPANGERQLSDSQNRSLITSEHHTVERGRNLLFLLRRVARPSSRDACVEVAARVVVIMHPEHDA